jgi:hypothetical protein
MMKTKENTMIRLLRVMTTALVLVFLVAPTSLHAQRGGASRGGGTGMAARSSGARTGPGFVGPVRPFVNPPVSGFARPNQFPAFKSSRPFVRSPRSIVVTPGLGFGGFGYGYGYSPYYPSYGDPFYPYSYPYSPSSDYPYSQPSYAAPQGPDESGAGQNDALSYEVGRLSQEVESLRQEQAAQSMAPRPVPQASGPATPVVLVFRDGHRMEIQNYAIIGQTLWVLDETNSSKIPLADLDLDTTQRENRARGLRFSLPSR